jgi:hypothetical protein
MPWKLKKYGAGCALTDDAGRDDCGDYETGEIRRPARREEADGRARASPVAHRLVISILQPGDLL